MKIDPNRCTIIKDYFEKTILLFCLAFDLKTKIPSQFMAEAILKEFETKE